MYGVRRRFQLTILPGLVVLVLLFSPVLAPVAAQDTGSEIPPALAEQMRNLEQITSTLRDLSITRDIDHAFPTRAETIAYLQDVYDRQLPQAEIERTTAFYVVLGLLPADIDLRQVYLDLLGSQVAGFYDPDTRTMNVIPLLGEDTGSGLSLTEQIIYVHEFTHALQDMHFDLNAILPEDLSTLSPDRALAITSLVEGDATSVMEVYLQQAAANNPLAALSLLGETALSGNLLPPSDVPRILLDELTFPYEAGLNFVTQVWGSRGWDGVNAVYSDLPTTTEQIMHPQKYLDGEVALPVDLSAVDPGAGWEMVWDTTLGEFYLREYLRQFTEYDTAAQRAASGWGGDAFRVWRNGDDLAFTLRIVWDTPKDASEFEEVYTASGAFSPDCAAVAAGMLCAVMTPDGATVIAGAPKVELARSLIGQAGG